jgi:hypothetical protein
VELIACPTLAEAGKLLDRPGQLACPLLELREQPHVLNRSDGLIGEGLEKIDLPFAECSNLSASERDGAVPVRDMASAERQ